jgi:NADPH:quinone reductase-like Zn-dependent oxidoreductase
MGNTSEFRSMLRFYRDLELRPVVDEVFPLEKAAAAHERMESGEQAGKIVLSIRP